MNRYLLTGLLALVPVQSTPVKEAANCAELREVQALMYRGLDHEGYAKLPQIQFENHVMRGHSYLWDALARVEQLVKACDAAARETKL